MSIDEKTKTTEKLVIEDIKRGALSRQPGLWSSRGSLS